MVEALSGLPEQLIHRDCHPGNVLVDGVRVVAFIDCDHICIASPVLDLATFAAQRVKRRTSEEDRHAWLRDLPRLLDGYRSRRGLSAPEVSALPYMMMAFHIMLSHWFMSTSRMHCIQLDIDALSWIHEHFEGIEDSIVSGHPPHRQSR